MKLTLNKAAQTCGRSKATLLNAIKSGRLSAPKDDLREMLEKAEANAEHWRSMAERQQALLEDKRPKGFLNRFWKKRTAQG